VKRGSSGGQRWAAAGAAAASCVLPRAAAASAQQEERRPRRSPITCSVTGSPVTPATSLATAPGVSWVAMVEFGTAAEGGRWLEKAGWKCPWDVITQSMRPACRGGSQRGEAVAGLNIWAPDSLGAA
jgi:hypothetical protein